MIQSTVDFIKYFDSIRRRTMNYIRVVPADRLGWSPKEGEFTCADIIRHIIAAEKMFVRVATEGRWKYEEHESEQKQSLDELIPLLETDPRRSDGEVGAVPRSRFERAALWAKRGRAAPQSLALADGHDGT